MRVMAVLGMLAIVGCSADDQKAAKQAVDAAAEREPTPLDQAEARGLGAMIGSLVEICIVCDGAMLAPQDALPKLLAEIDGGGE